MMQSKLTIMPRATQWNKMKAATVIKRANTYDTATHSKNIKSRVQHNTWKQANKNKEKSTAHSCKWSTPRTQAIGQATNLSYKYTSQQSAKHSVQNTAKQLTNTQHCHNHKNKHCTAHMHAEKQTMSHSHACKRDQNTQDESKTTRPHTQSQAQTKLREH